MCAQPGLTLFDLMHCSPPHSSVQAGMLEWVAILLQGIFPTQGLNSAYGTSPALAGRFFTTVPRDQFTLNAEAQIHMHNHTPIGSKPTDTSYTQLTWNPSAIRFTEKLTVKFIGKI